MRPGGEVHAFAMCESLLVGTIFACRHLLLPVFSRAQQSYLMADATAADPVDRWYMRQLRGPEHPEKNATVTRI